MKLTRFAATPDGVIGRIGRWCVLEEQDRSNQQNVSAIPAGQYTCRRSFFNRGGYETFELVAVPGRSQIKFHIGNTEEDTAGCLLLGWNFGALTVRDEETGDYRPKIAVTSSRDAFQAFMDMLEGVDEFELVIEEYYRGVRDAG